MKKIISLLVSCLLTVATFAQSDDTGKIVLTPYVENSENTPQANTILLDRLNQIVTHSGMVGAGLTTPFIITAHAIELSRTYTSTIPAMTVVTLSVTVYIGNADDGTLFSSCNLELRGVGNSAEEAYVSAFRKINANNSNLNDALTIGKQRICDYYNSNAAGLMSRAKAQAASGQYGDAYNSLLSIPSICNQYEQAQSLLAQLSQEQTESNNQELLTKARAAWSASPTESGAAEAESYIDQIISPTASVSSQATTLLNEISTRLQRQQAQERADRLKAEERAHIEQMQAEENAHSERMQYAKNAHNERIALIKGATKVAAARAASRPRVVYNIHWW